MSYFNRHVIIIELLEIVQPICKFQVVKLLSWKETTFQKSFSFVSHLTDLHVFYFDLAKLELYIKVV